MTDAIIYLNRKGQELVSDPYLVDYQKDSKGSILLRHSDAATVLLKRLRDRLAYDGICRAWAKYAYPQWYYISDPEAFQIVWDEIELGAGGLGFSATYISGILTFLKSGLFEPHFNANRDLIPFQNGCLNLNGSGFISHSPSHRLTWTLPCEFASGAKCERVLEWLKETTGSDERIIELIQAFFNAVVRGRSDLQRFLEVIGPGATGKSTLIGLLINLVGANNSIITSLRELEVSRFETARLYGKRLAVITDSDTYGGSVSVLKSITGRDPVRLERKHIQAGADFVYQGMVVIAANQPIESTDYTSGLQRRRITIEFNRRIDPEDRDTELASKLALEIPGVIQWALRISDERVRELLLNTNNVVPTAGNSTTECLAQTNPILGWAREELVLDETAVSQVGCKREVTRSFGDQEMRESRTVLEHAANWLYANFCMWCRASGQKELGLRGWTKNLVELLSGPPFKFPVERLDNTNGQGVRVKGIRLRDARDEGKPLLF